MPLKKAGNERLLNDLGIQELKDYCKYIQMPTVPSWGRDKLAGELASMLRSHLEYMMYEFFEDEWKELNRLRRRADGVLRAERKHRDISIKAMALGIMDVKFPEGEEGNRAVLELVFNTDELFPIMTAGRTGDDTAISAKCLVYMILTHGMIEILAMYTLLGGIYE